MKNKKGGAGEFLLVLIILIISSYFILPSVFNAGYSGVQNIFKNLNISLPNIPTTNTNSNIQNNQKVNTNPNSNCTPSWTCGSWTSCSGSTQTRTCSDSNDCGILISKPSLSQSCTVSCSPNWQTGSWSACSNGEQTRTVNDLNNCGVSTNKPTNNQICGTPITSAQLNSYLSTNPNVNYWVSQMSSSSHSYFLNYFNNLETTGKTGVTKPNINELNSAIWKYMSYKGSVTPYSFSSSNQNDVDRIFAAKVAHSIWLDIHNKVSWKLNDYSQNDLGYILSEESFIKKQWDAIYLDWSPDLDYDYSKNYIRNTKSQTLNDLIESFRNFHHGQGPGGGTASESTIQGALNDKSSVGGCSGMSVVVSAISDNLNLITTDESVGWIGAGHAGVIWQGSYVLLHGDDIYNSILQSTPGIDSLATWDYFTTYVRPVGRGDVVADSQGVYHGQINYYAMRWDCLNALKYPPQTMVYKCCNVCNKDRNCCANSFDLGYSYMIPSGSPTSCLTTDETNQLVNKMLAKC